MSKYNQENLNNLFTTAKNTPVSMPPYMATRIIAIQKEKKAKSKGLLLWKSLALSSLSLCLLLVFTLTTKSTSQLEALSNEPYLVRVEMNKINKLNVAEAEIILPEGVYFYSKSMPELNNLNELRLAWSSDIAKPILPFIVKANKNGTQKVKIRFLDKNNQ